MDFKSQIVLTYNLKHFNKKTQISLILKKDIDISYITYIPDVVTGEKLNTILLNTEEGTTTQSSIRK